MSCMKVSESGWGYTENNLLSYFMFQGQTCFKYVIFKLGTLLPSTWFFFFKVYAEVWALKCIRSKKVKFHERNLL